MGKFHGSGKLVDRDHSVYVGEFVKGWKRGSGSIVYANGDSYEGSFKAGLFHGQGKYTYGDNGEVREGLWLKGELVELKAPASAVQHADTTSTSIRSCNTSASVPESNAPVTLQTSTDGGTTRPATGSSKSNGNADHSISYLSNRVNQRADNYRTPPATDTAADTIQYANGDTYTGATQNNKPHGVGTYTSIYGAVYKGDHVHGQRCGNGTIEYKDGGLYVGQFKHDVRHGEGRLIEPDGREYEGSFYLDRREGHGTLHLGKGGHYTGDTPFMLTVFFAYIC